MIPNDQWGRELWLAVAMRALDMKGDELQQIYIADCQQARDGHFANAREYKELYANLCAEHESFKAYYAGHKDLVEACDCLHRWRSELLNSIEKITDELWKLKQDADG